MVAAAPALLLEAQRSGERQDMLLGLHVGKGQQSLGQRERLGGARGGQLDCFARCRAGACGGAGGLGGAAAEEALALAQRLARRRAVEQREDTRALLLLEQLGLGRGDGGHGVALDSRMAEAGRWWFCVFWSGPAGPSARTSGRASAASRAGFKLETAGARQVQFQNAKHRVTLRMQRAAAGAADARRRARASGQVTGQVTGQADRRRGRRADRQRGMCQHTQAVCRPEPAALRLCSPDTAPALPMAHQCPCASL